MGISSRSPHCQLPHLYSAEVGLVVPRALVLGLSVLQLVENYAYPAPVHLLANSCSVECTDSGVHCSCVSILVHIRCVCYPPYYSLGLVAPQELVPDVSIVGPVPIREVWTVALPH